MKLKQNENWPSVILHNGKPYLLKKLTRKGVNDSCSMCDLHQLCWATSYAPALIDLCCLDGRGEAYYYEEDWSIYDKQIADFVNDRLP